MKQNEFACLKQIKKKNSGSHEQNSKPFLKETVPHLEQVVKSWNGAAECTNLHLSTLSHDINKDCR